ncbi:MAG: carboxylating nicotinate-nucleotide diphosphorylase, partial [candidate division WOR-3 bacterium]
ARSLLTAERTALNFVQRMSGVATLTRRYVDAVKGTGAVILDTRKTVPGWRLLDKYAVRCGGGQNHRRGLYDMVIIKDNHIQVCGSIAAALERCRRARRPVEVETRTLADVREALAAGADWIMLDNMPLRKMRRAVRMVAGRCRVEASGGITLANVRRAALTGVDFISVGALTHSAPAADIALDFLPR